jgi:hypothetical protein
MPRLHGLCTPAPQSLVANENFTHILRVLNTNVDGKEKIMYALTSIKGIGRRFSNVCCKKAEVDLNKRCGPPPGSRDAAGAQRCPPTRRRRTGPRANGSPRRQAAMQQPAPAQQQAGRPAPV